MIKRLAILAAQVLLLSLLAWIGDAVAAYAHLPIPGSILMMAVLFILLKTGMVRLSWFEKGADWLHGWLVLFFVPSVVGISQYGKLMQAEGLRLFLAVLLGTLSVMAVSGLIAEKLRTLQGGGRP